MNIVREGHLQFLLFNVVFMYNFKDAYINLFCTAYLYLYERKKFIEFYFSFICSIHYKNSKFIEKEYSLMTNSNIQDLHIG